MITLPAVDNEHAVKNRLNAEQIATVLPIVVERYPFYAPMIFALYTLGLRYCHVAAMRWEKLTSDGVIALEETYDVSANVFSQVDQRKKAPPVIALEPRTLELVRWHRRYLTRRKHRGLNTGLLFPSEAGTRPVGNDQLNDVWREVQVLAGIDRPVTVHGIRHNTESSIIPGYGTCSATTRRRWPRGASSRSGLSEASQDVQVPVLGVGRCPARSPPRGLSRGPRRAQ
jgi:hypothetical protein